MTFALALRSLKAKPLRTLASVAAIAVAVAMFFCMFSFEGAVYDYVYAVETADFGDSDIIISQKSGGDRIAPDDPLYDVEGVESVTATVSLYALLDGEGEEEYLRLRGFDGGEVESLRDIDVVAGDISRMAENTDCVVISERMAERFGLGIDDSFSVRGMTATGRSVHFYVVAIAENSGYFASDSPYTVLGYSSRMSSVMLSGGTVYNEIFVKVAEGADISKVRERIAAIPEYSALTVAECLDLGYISTRARNLSAPVTIAGAAVALLCIAGVALVFTSGVRERRAYAAKLALVGGTKRRIFAMFALESALLAAAGAVIGSLVAVGIFALMLYIVLSSAMSFSVNAALLFAAAVTGALTAFAASLYPLVRVFSSTARENLVGAPEKGRAGLFATAALVLATLVSLCVENLLPGAKGALSAVNMVLVIACAAMAAPFIVKGFGRLAISSRSPSVIVAGVSSLRERRATRASSILAVGMTMSMLLFTAWSLTTSVFSDFTSEFEDMILVTNLSSDVDVSELEEVEGVRGAHLMVWRQAVISADGMEEKTVNILGSATALELVEFEYATPREEVVAALAEGKVILDGSVRELYGVDKGDFVLLDVDGETRRFEVGGIVRHNLFNGSYVIVSAETLGESFGLSADTVVLLADGDVGDVAREVRSRFADRNYYALPALAAYEWDTRALENVFDLIAALAFMLTALAYAVAIANVVVGRAYSERTRSTLLCAGLSRNGLLASETLEHAFSATSAFLLSLPVSALATMCLINALRMFGLYFGFMFDAASAVAAGLVLSAAYIAVPVIAGFKRGYGMRRN